jgi:hypothetical protein
MLTLAVTALAAAPLQSSEVTSPGSVTALVRALGERQLTAVAAKHPSEAGRYIAAMHFPGVQLLVISARTHSPEYIDAKLAAGAYADVYAALQQGVPESKLFIHDMGGDGLRGGVGGTADIVYERGKDVRVIDGDHKAAGMSKAEYDKVIRQLDQKYTELLRVLVQAIGANRSTGLPGSL